MPKTEFEFTLPKGYIDDQGNLQKTGVMRLATAADEILPLKDPRVVKNPAYLKIVLLSKVITRLGSLQIINTKTIENLFASDLEYLQQLYNKINGEGNTKMKTICPKCKAEFSIEEGNLGE
jgi:hypothetical protein